ncbi:hypothetical protein N0V93_007687 [Gnomoniopsis smithogilvyi]|uniref:CFEM domain-containing protein n=1 Tax=Gnomoniopsis smithogilvyi TaxID=1191159 RepID=A0A9W8YNL4_9PEZI|nr:hypothetical protein N0V93_007687 [Gnomoniopsis smithogilvyi]
MQLSTFSVALFAGLSMAQFSGLPTCAQGCASEQFSGGSYAGCGTDPKCICENQSFLGNVACCLQGACDSADQTSAIAFATQICSAQGVSVPTVVSCSTAASSGATASGSAATTTATATTGTAASSSATGTGTVATSGSTAGAWAPRQTAAMGLEMLGLAAAGAGIVFM